MSEHALCVLEALFGVFDAMAKVVPEVGAQGEVVEGRDRAFAYGQRLAEPAFRLLYPALMKQLPPLAVELKHLLPELWMGGEKLHKRVMESFLRPALHRHPFPWRLPEYK